MITVTTFRSMRLLTLIFVCGLALSSKCYAAVAEPAVPAPQVPVAAQVININGAQPAADKPKATAQELSFQRWVGLSYFYSLYFEPQHLMDNPLSFSQDALILAGMLYLGSSLYNHWDAYQKMVTDAATFTQRRMEDTYNATCATGRFAYSSGVFAVARVRDAYQLAQTTRQLAVDGLRAARQALGRA